MYQQDITFWGFTAYICYPPLQRTGSLLVIFRMVTKLASVLGFICNSPFSFWPLASRYSPIGPNYDHESNGPFFFSVRSSYVTLVGLARTKPTCCCQLAGPNKLFFSIFLFISFLFSVFLFMFMFLYSFLFFVLLDQGARYKRGVLLWARPDCNTYVSWIQIERERCQYWLGQTCHQGVLSELDE